MKRLRAKLGGKKADGQAPKEAADVPRTIRQSTGLSSVTLGIVAFLLSAAVLAVAGGLAYLQYAAQAAKVDVATAHARTHGIAGQVAARIAVYSDIISQAASRPGLARAIAADTGALEQESDRLRRLLPGVLRVRFVRPDESTPDANEKPRLSYACLDLAHRVSGKVPPPAEVHLFGGPDQHIDIARAVVGSGTPVAGALLVSLDVKLLRSWLKRSVAHGAYAELRQDASRGDYLLLASEGNASRQGGAVRYVSPVPGTLWRLVFWPAPGGGLSGGERTGFLAIFGAALGALAVLFVLLTLTLRRLLRTDLVKLVHLIDEVWRGQRQHSFAVRLAEVKRVADDLEQQVNRVRHAPPEKVASPLPEPPGAGVEVREEEPMPGVMFIDRSAVSVEESEEDGDLPSPRDGKGSEVPPERR